MIAKRLMSKKLKKSIGKMVDEEKKAKSPSKSND
jgi:hypothetical protein